MSDDLDKFVLQYQVELKDSIERLEKLNQKIEETNKNSDKAKQKEAESSKKAAKDQEAIDKKSAKDKETAANKAKQEAEKAAKAQKKAAEDSANNVRKFANDSAKEIDQLVPGVEKATGMVTGLGKSFGVAAAAVAVLGLGIKSVMNLRELYEKQRSTGQDVGVSPVRLEEYQRKFQKYGEGRVSRDQVLENVKAISDKRSAAYADPTRMGNDARLMRMIGIDVGKLGDKPASTNEIMSKLGARMAQSSEKDALAMGAQFGLSQDFSRALRKQGAEVGKVTETSESELKDRAEANKNLDKFNSAMAKMNEELLKAGNTIAEKLLPFLTSMTEKAASLAKYIPAAAEESNKFLFKPGYSGKTVLGALGAGWDAITGKDSFGDSYQKRMQIGKYDPDLLKKEAQRKEEKAKETKENGGVEKTVDDIVEGFDKTNRESKGAIDEFQLAINMFSGSVSSFANAIDEKQAWAAWAGEIGKAAGLNSPGAPGLPGEPGLPGLPGAPGEPVNRFGSETAFKGTTQYDPFFDEAGKRFGVSADILKKVTKVESEFNPKAVSKVGAQGLMQVMPENSKKLGVSDPFDPRSNIMAGAEILSQNLKMAGGDIRQALMMYHGGLDRSAWGPKTLSYPDKVLNQGIVSSKAESKAKINLKALQDNVAQRLGVDVSNVQQGRINKGDVTWTLNQKDSELQNKITDLNRQRMTANLPKTEYDRIARETRETQMGLETLRRYRGKVEDKAQEGGRQITVGQMPVYVNVTSSGTPSNIVDDVKQGIKQGIYDAANDNSDGKVL